MGKIIINGKEFLGNNICIKSGNVIIDDINVTVNIKDRVFKIQGDISGDINCTNLEVVGNIKGDIDCTNITVNGDIDGDVDGTNVTILK